jgi:hypothetical protein
MAIHDNEAIFLTQEEKELFLLSQTKVTEEADDTEHQAFENSIKEEHQLYNLQSKKIDGISPKKITKTKKIVKTKRAPEPSTEKILEKGNAKVPAKRNLTILKISSQTDLSSTNSSNTSTENTIVEKLELQSQRKAPTPFSLEGELAKVKIPIPLSELMSKDYYRSHVIKELRIEPDIGMKALTVGSTNHSDTVNLTDDQPELLFGPKVDGQTENGVVAPFYIIVNIHDLILHNAMLDSGASHSLMPKAVMEKLCNNLTRIYT